MKFWNFLGLEGLAYTGVGVSFFVLATFVIKELVSYLPRTIAFSPHPTIVAYAFVLAIVSVPLSLAFFALKWSGILDLWGAEKSD
jgi:hypothetical protein|tara:strand:+ start:726 stop:980 length:255 start_codon:yes stop_codon:yes gene_type:complete